MDIRGRKIGRWIGVIAVMVGVVATAATEVGATGGRGLTDQTYNVAGLVGVATGQAARLDVSNVATTQCNARLELLSAKGIVINFRSVEIGAGASQSLKYAPTQGAMVRPRVISLKDSCGALLVSLEIVDVRTGRTEALFSGGRLNRVSGTDAATDSQ
jgi:hypothetical protein